MDRKDTRNERQIEEIRFSQSIRASIASKLGLSDLTSGYQGIRNERGWLDNEKDIEYSWIVQIARSFVRWGGLTFIKFNYRKYRDIENKEDLTKMIFLHNGNGDITDYYVEHEFDNFIDPLANTTALNLFAANRGITLDGIVFHFHIMAQNIDSVIKLNNPNTDSWRKWEQNVREIGAYLAYNSKNNEMIELFK